MSYISGLLAATDQLVDAVRHEITQLDYDSETADALREAVAEFVEARESL